MSRMRWCKVGWLAGMVAALLALSACETSEVLVPVDGSGSASPPRNLDVSYYAGAVLLTWDLPSRWDGEFFRIYGRRVTDSDFFLVADVTNCSDGACAYSDRNVVPNVTYEYYVASVDPRSGAEAPSAYSVEILVPRPDPPPVPGEVEAIALDNAIFLRWNQASRAVDDFHFYRVYLEEADGGSFLLGETDSEGFLDLLVENGATYGYFVTAVDRQGHESGGSFLAEATPRPDFRGELLYAVEDRSSQAGFIFRESEDLDPVVSGNDPARHFRVEIDAEGWWLVPGPGVQVHQDSWFTTSLRCGPAADAGCTDLRVAPLAGYGTQDMQLVPELSYVLRVPAEGGGWRYGVIRVSHVGFAQDGAIVIFDWAYQLQVGNPALSPVPDAPIFRE